MASEINGSYARPALWDGRYKGNGLLLRWRFACNFFLTLAAL
jgi:hypothetical protein